MIDHAIAGLQAGDPVVLPFDTVYGLAADPFRKEPTRRLYELKGRDQTEPSALVARDLDQLLVGRHELGHVGLESPDARQIGRPRSIAVAQEPPAVGMPMLIEDLPPLA